MASISDTLATTLAKTTSKARDPKEILLGMYDKENATFTNEYLPILEQMQADMKGRRSEYVAAATDEAADLTALQQNTANSQRSQLGVVQTAEQAASSGRKGALGLAQAAVLGQNKAIDTADTKNLETANGLADIATGIRNQAINNASSASGLASGRETQGAQNKANAQAQNTQLATAAVTTAAMVMM